MDDDKFSANNALKQFIDVYEGLWEKFQGSLFDNNILSKAMEKSGQDDLNIFFDALTKNPIKTVELQWKWWQGQLNIYQNVMNRSLDNREEALFTPENGDRRFENPLWDNQPQYDLLKQSYLHFSHTLLDMVDSAEEVPEQVRYRIHFFLRQIINAYSPGNFLWSNPDVIQQTLNENGENIVRGMQILREDLTKGGKYLSIRMVNDNAFTLGKDLAITPGGVVFENEVFQLIQYEPVTPEVNKTPLLIIPPFINKYYILDLRENNSFVNWLRHQGHTVFLMSWRNPTAEQRDITFDDLVTSGVMEACRVVKEVSEENELNAIGYCIGGTLLAATQAYCVAKKIKKPFKSATYMATILDFQNPGSLGVFINEPVISAIEALNNQLGYFDGRQLAITFRLLRENTLYWNYYIENYLKGKSPTDFDILYWNCDSTHISGKVHNFLLRNLYLNNELIQPNKIIIDGAKIDLSKVKTPAFCVAAQDDHISLWETCFQGVQRLGGEKTLVLGESGHIAGIVNPPSRNKYGYYTHEKGAYQEARQWLEGATLHEGSWWSYWQNWVSPYLGEKVPARLIGSTKYPVIESAPGRYVQVSVF